MNTSNIVKTQPLHIQAYNIIKKLIIDGEYKPGERVVEVKLAEKLGISRGPIREAIRMLIHDGLLVQEDGPLRLYKPTLQDIIEVFQCRVYLEALAVRLAAENYTPELKETLTENLKGLEDAIARNSRSAISMYDQRFHETILEASKNQQLLTMMSGVRAKIAYMRKSILQNYYSKFNFIEEHNRIAQAIFAKDLDKAEQEMKDHITKNLNFIIHVLKELGE